jgi:hypothetical protein
MRKTIMTMLILAAVSLSAISAFAGGLDVEKASADQNYQIREERSRQQQASLDNVPDGIKRTVEDLLGLTNQRWYREVQNNCETQVVYYVQSDVPLQAGMDQAGGLFGSAGIKMGSNPNQGGKVTHAYGYKEALSGKADRDKVNGLCSQSIPGSQYNFFSKTGEISYGSLKLSVQAGQIFSFSSRTSVNISGTVSDRARPTDWYVTVQDQAGQPGGLKVEFRFNLETGQWSINDASLSTSVSRRDGDGKSWDRTAVGKQYKDPPKESRSEGTDYSRNMLMSKVADYYREKLIGGFSLFEFATALVNSPELREKVVSGN